MKNEIMFLSLSGKEAKDATKVLSSDTSRKILEYLSKKKGTEKEMSKKLKIPFSSVHYTLNKLEKYGFVSADEFHYSEKGREVKHYAATKKHIVITQDKESFLKKITNFVPVATIIAGGALLLENIKDMFLQQQQTTITNNITQTVEQQTYILENIITIFGGQTTTQSVDSAQFSTVVAETTAQAADEYKETLVNETSEVLLEPEIVTQTIVTEPNTWANITLWFILGAVFALVIYSVWCYLKEKYYG